jgi:hypothetical protein
LTEQHISIMNQRMTEAERTQKTLLGELSGLQEKLKLSLENTDRLLQSIADRSAQGSSVLTQHQALLFQHVEGQIGVLVKQMEVQKEVSVTGIQLQQEWSNMVESKLKRLEQQQRGIQPWVEEQFKKMNDYSNSQLVALQQNMNRSMTLLHSTQTKLEEKVNQLQNALESADQRLSTSIHTLDTMLHKGIQILHEQAEKIRTEDANERQLLRLTLLETMDKDSTIRAQDIQQRILKEVQDHLQLMDQKVIQQHQHMSILEDTMNQKLLSSILKQQETLDQTTIELQFKSDTKLQKAIQDMEAILTVIKDSMHLIRQNEQTARLQTHAAMDTLRDEIQTRTMQLKEELRKEMALIDRPVFLV